MAIKIEVDLSCDITIHDILNLTDMSYGCFDDMFTLKYNEIGKHTLIYNHEVLCRGIDVSIDEQTVCFQLLLPSSSKEISFLYEVVSLLCEKYNIKEIVKNDEYLLIKHIERLIQEDILESEKTLFEIKEEINDRIYICYCIYHPISLSLKELDEIESLEDFSNKIHQLQSINAYYEIPYFYKSKQGHTIGMYFAGVNEPAILPIYPHLVTVNYPVDDYFIQIDGMYRLKYHDFLSRMSDMEPYDASHMIFKITHDQMYELVKYHYDLSINDYREAIYWNRVLDDGRRHASKVKNMDLDTESINGYNHLAVYLIWMIEHDLLSDKLIEQFDDIKEYINDQSVDVRELIKENECFLSQLKLDHFNEEGKAFSEYCYKFNADGFPHCVDFYAKKVLGEERYHCDEYKDEAYLFVDYDETYIQGLSEYLDELYEEFKKIDQND